MKPHEFLDAKLLWKIFYANHTFKHAKAAALHIVEKNLTDSDPLFHPLLVSVYVLYARPFTRADGVGNLDEKYVPNQYRSAHKAMLQHRNKVYAHRDAEGFVVEDLGNVNQVRAINDGEKIILMAANLHTRAGAMAGIIELCEALEKKTDGHIGELWAKYNGQIQRKIGEFLLNIADEKTDMWIPQKPLFLGV